MKFSKAPINEGLVSVDAGGVTLEGNLLVPSNARGIVVFAHGSGSSRFSTRNRYVADVLRGGGMGTLLMDLLSSEEEDLRFDIAMLAKRLVGTVNWLRDQHDLGHQPVGLFGASTGGGAALVAAAQIPAEIGAVVSRGGRPDLAGAALPHVTAPTLLIVGGDDTAVIAMNQEAYNHMHCERRMEIVPGATHLFEEPGTLETVADLARDWFVRHLQV